MSENLLYNFAVLGITVLIIICVQCVHIKATRVTKVLCKITGEIYIFHFVIVVAFKVLYEANAINAELSVLGSVFFSIIVGIIVHSFVVFISNWCERRQLN